MGIFVAIFSVAAFDLFADRDPDNFGSFSRSLFSMFQVSRPLSVSLSLSLMQLQLKAETHVEMETEIGRETGGEEAGKTALVARPQHTHTIASLNAQ